MVTRSIDNWNQHKQDVQEVIQKKYGDEYAEIFIKMYSDRYDKFNRSYLDYELAFVLVDEYHKLKNEGTRWYACVGPRRTGKSTLMQNVSYFVDTSFELSRVNLGIRGFIHKLNEYPKRNAMKSLFMDEPDNTFHTSSKEGRLLKDVITRMGQQNLFCGICSTTLTAIPSYIWKEIDGIFFLPFKGKGMFFRNEPEQRNYALQTIRETYAKKGYETFFDLEKKNQCMHFDTGAATSFTKEQMDDYTEHKEDDYTQTITAAMKGLEPKPLTETMDKYVQLKKQGFKVPEIAEKVGVNERTVYSSLERSRKRLGVLI